MDSFWAPSYTNRLEIRLLYSSNRHFPTDTAAMKKVNATSLGEASFSRTTMLII